MAVESLLQQYIMSGMKQTMMKVLFIAPGPPAESTKVLASSANGRVRRLQGCANRQEPLNWGGVPSSAPSPM